MSEENKKNISEEPHEDDVVLMVFMFRGSYLSQKLGHEVINLFMADDKSHYIYVSPYGYVSDLDKIRTILLARHIGNSKVEILAKAKVEQPFLSPNDSRKKNRKSENLKNIKKRQSILCEKIYYGRKNIIDIFQFNKPGDRQHILVSFKVTDFRFSKKDDSNEPIVITYGKKDKKEYDMEGNMPRQSLKTYFSVNKGKDEKEKEYNRNNYKKLMRIINNDTLWKDEDTCKPICENDKPKNDMHYFIKLMGKEDDEIAFSNLFHYYFSKKDVLNKFICQVLGNEDDRIKEVDSYYNIYRERKHTDILIEDDNQIIVIENKIKADIHGNQLSRYYDSAKDIAEERAKNCDLREEPKILCFIFVPDYNRDHINKKMNEAKDNKFKIITYKKIYNFFMEMKKDNDADLEYMEEFCNALQRHAQPSYPDDLHDENLYAFLKTIHQS